MKIKTPEAISTTHKGSRWRRLWQSAADGVCPEISRPVASHGRSFYNRDGWTARAAVVAMCEDIKGWDASRSPLDEDWQRWAAAGNQALRDVTVPSIVVAATAEELTTRDRDAIFGGCVHEKGHTAYSCRRHIDWTELRDIVAPLWDLVPNWAPLAGAILNWGNLIEDIRIERLLCKDYVGTPPRLASLQDFVLDMEAKGLEAAEHRGLPVNDDLRVVQGSFRDIGLGYDTPTQNAVLDEYKTASPAGWALVTEGDLKPLLDESIALGEKNKDGDDLAHLPLAMRVIATLIDLSDSPVEDEDGDGPGDGEIHCPACGAGASMLRSRPVKGKPNKIAIVCTDCGHKEIVDVQKGEGGGGGGKTITIEDPNADPSDCDGDGAGGSKGDDSSDGGGSGGSDGKEPDIRSDGGEAVEDDSDGEGEDGDGEDGEGTDSEGEDADGEGKADSGDADGAPKGEDGSEGGDASDGDSDTSDGEDGEGEDADGDSDPTGDTPRNEAQTDGKDGDGAGGHSETEQDALTLEEIAAAIVDAMEDGDENGLKDSLTALNEIVEKALDNEDKDCEYGERVWRPMCPDLDQVVTARDAGRTAATALRNKARKQSAALKTQLRRKFLAERGVRRFHGVKRGGGLSDRRLVDSAVELIADVVPTRPDYTDLAKRDCSLAAAIVVDQSSSMCRRRADAAVAMLALADGLDAVGAPVLCCGFRNGQYNYHNQYGCEEAESFHRDDGIIIDVFKGWDEPLRNVLPRFPNVQATGGTPMSDGIQYGLQALSDRPERHRVLFVLTDGEPNHGHLPVIRRQIRIAREAGIEVVGIGIDSGCEGVKRVFDTGFAVRNLDELPKALLTVLDAIVFPSRAKRVKLDGKFARNGRTRRRTG